MLERRKFLAGLTGLICAPAIVRASSIMPVRGWVEPDMRWFLPTDRLPEVGASGGSHFKISSFNNAGNLLSDTVIVRTLSDGSIEWIVNPR